VVVATTGGKSLVWNTPAGDAGSKAADGPDAACVSLLPGQKFTVLAAANGKAVGLHAIDADGKFPSVLASGDGVTAKNAIDSLAVAADPADPGRVVVAVGLSDGAALFDLPLSKTRDGTTVGSRRPFSEWAAPDAAGPVAAAYPASGPELVAGNGVYRPEFLLRVHAAGDTAGAAALRCQLRVAFGGAPVDGVVTATRGLDLRIDQLLARLGVKGPAGVTVRPSLIQDRYHGFLLEPAGDRPPGPAGDPSFGGGGLVVWEENSSDQGHRLRGLALVEDHTATAEATVRFPGGRRGLVRAADPAPRRRVRHPDRGVRSRGRDVEPVRR
jgi:hypothetical protein